MNKKIISLVILCVAFLAGCGRQYQVKPLKHVRKTEAQFIEQKENIELRVKKLDHPDIQRIFSEQDLENKRISSLLITIKNDSTKAIVFDNSLTNLTLLSADKLKSYLSKNTALKVVLGIAAIPIIVVASVFSGCALATLLGIHGCCAMGFVVLPFLASIAIGIPVIVGTTGYSIHNANKFNNALAADIKRKVLTSQNIAPGKKESALLFTKDIPETFTITLLKGQEKVPFTVTLKNLAIPKTKN